MPTTASPFTAVYGPVKSWRFGQSLGIDPIGPISTCSFGCVYCQLGTIQHPSAQRQCFIPTAQIEQELRDRHQALQTQPATVDVVTLSGSGEPTLALNLGEIITAAQGIMAKPVVVLTNATLLGDAAVRADLNRADIVAVKIDAVGDRPLQGVNRPVPGVDWANVALGLQTFAPQYPGRLAVQTMVLAPWGRDRQQQYIDFVATLQPQEIQLNIPRRPHVLVRHLAARGNAAIALEPEAQRQLHCVDPSILIPFAQAITDQTGIPVRYPPGAGAP